MKRFAFIIAATLGLGLAYGSARADWGSKSYSGYQPWYNVCAKRYHCKTCEEKRLEHFWRDYYHSLRCYYGGLEHLDWVAYYKNHGYQINAGCGGAACGPNGACGGPSACPQINYAPVVVTPGMQWAVPAGCMNGPPAGPGCAGPGCFGPSGN